MKKLIVTAVLSSFLGCSNSKTINVEGKIAMYGSVPHTYLGINDIATNKVYKIENASAFHLIKMQNKTIKANAIILKKAIGPGYPTVIKVLSIKR